MKHSALITASLLAIFLIGCGGPHVELKGENGETVKLNNSGHMEVTDKNGKTASIDGGQGKMTVQDAKGTTTMESKDGKLSVKGPEGNMEMSPDAVKEGDLGVPFYPGSTSVNSQKTTTSGKMALLSVRETADTPDKVGEFYKGKFKSESNANSTQGDTQMVVMAGKLGDGRTISLNASQAKGAKTTVTIAVGQE